MNYNEIFYVSNILSVLRILLVIPVYYLLVLNTTSASYWAVFVMFLAALTDSFDGRLARKLNQQTDLGRILDPLADKIAIAVVAILLVSLRGLPFWFLALILFRDLAILLVGVIVMRKRKIVVESVAIGKITATGLAALMMVYTLDIQVVKEIGLWINVGLVVVSSYVYFMRFRSFLVASESGS